MPPKRNKKNNEGEVAEDLDVMLADFRAADLANASSSQVAHGAADVYASPSNIARAQASDVTVSEATILAAIRAGDLTRLRRWHRQGVEISAEHLCVAARLGSNDMMRCLVEELGADVNGASFGGDTPLIVASWNDKVDLVRYLVRTLGADVKKADARGASALFAAAQKGNLEVVRCLLKDLGADVHQAIDDGATPLLVAAEDGRLAVVQLLVREHGADINQARQDGATPLLLAAQNGHLNVVQCLVEDFGADVNTRDLYGRSLLMLASYGKHMKLVKWLLKHGADAQASAAYGTAADVSRYAGAPIVQTEYLKAKAHCSNPGCSGAGLKKCTGCKQARYCGQTCQLAHWNAHKADCKANTKVYGS